jgi:ubiquinone/menaquinone biosynthesis C-methylase UbiE
MPDVEERAPQERDLKEGDLKERFMQQERWNQFGKDRLAKMQEHSQAYLVTRSPHAHRLCNTDLMTLLGPLVGKNVLELGCGRGEFAVFLAKQGANVTGVDIGPDLIAASRAIAAMNNVACRFHAGNINRLPFQDGKFDFIVGIAVLHHLMEQDVRKALQECHRVLKAGGRAVFYEPVENSPLFDFIQNLFPAGGKGERYRPSLLQHAAWADYVANKDERPLTSKELLAAGKPFRSVTLRQYGCLIRLRRLLGASTRKYFIMLDKLLFRICPPLKYFCKSVLVEYRK